MKITLPVIVPPPHRFTKETARLAGALGGQKTVATHGIEHMRELGRKGAAVIKLKYGHDYFRELGRKAHAKPA